MRTLIATLGIVLLGAQAPEPVISVGLPGPASHVEFVGDRVVAGAWSMLALFDLTTGIVNVRQPQGSLVEALAVSPNGRLLAVGTCGHKIRLRDANSLRLVRDLELRQECAETLSFSPDGSFLATGAYGCGPKNNGLQVWDVDKGTIARELGAGLGIRRVVFAGDGSWLAGVDDKDTVHVFEWPSGRERWRLQGAGQSGYSGSEVFASRDGRHLGWKGDGLVVWDVSTGHAVGLPGAREYDVHDMPPGGQERRWKEVHVPASAARFLEDGRLAYVDEAKVHLRILPNGPEQLLDLPEEKPQFIGDVGLVRQHEWLRLSSDARLLVGTRESETRVWDVLARRAIELAAPALGLPTSVGWGRSGTVFWGNLAAGVRAWDTRFGQLEDLGPQAKDAQVAALSPDGSRLALAGFSSLSIMDAPTHRVLVSKEFGPAAETAVALSARGGRVAYADSKEGLGIFDSQLQLVRRLAALGPLERLEEVALSPDGRWLAAGVGGREPYLRVWAIESGEATTLDKQVVTYGHQPPAFSADSRSLASFKQGKSVMIWSTGSWATTRTIGLSSSGRSLSFAPIGPRLAVASDDETAIWDSSTGTKLVTLTAPDVGERGAIAWSPDGRRLVSTADDGALRFWYAQDGRLLASLYVPERIDDWLLLTPDGRLDGSEPALRKHLAWRMGDRVARDARESSTRRTPGLWRTVAFSP